MEESRSSALDIRSETASRRLDRVAVSVAGEEASVVWCETREDLLRVTTTAKRRVHVDAARVRDQPVDALVSKHRHVVGAATGGHVGEVGGEADALGRERARQPHARTAAARAARDRSDQRGRSVVDDHDTVYIGFLIA